MPCCAGVVVLNITPQLTHLGTLCFLRGIFGRLVATKPTSCFKYSPTPYLSIDRYIFRSVFASRVYSLHVAIRIV